MIACTTSASRGVAIRFPHGRLPLGNNQPVERNRLECCVDATAIINECKILTGRRFLVDSFGGHNEINPTIEDRSDAMRLYWVALESEPRAHPGLFWRERWGLTCSNT